MFLSKLTRKYWHLELCSFSLAINTLAYIFHIAFPLVFKLYFYTAAQIAPVAGLFE